ncbi:LysR family transcriptional regulator [Pandoraea terrae]|uniref:LysR family transcriptional regulator n=1 Tax=Pandoraea terrae TaxID=1537710 RepID=A0A5E4UYE9_9BURK|nr:LysR substrate-binding domain-containing protein [Pandoraea terrae]VVE05052.1 LysR family transcriptional regulator [Pandoraea terrae]
MKTLSDGAKGYRRIIPSLTALVEFEAVARLGSFTLAAHELGVSQAAVSRQVKMLEESLGVLLFQRLYRSIKLTREGEALHEAVAEAMQRIAGAFDHLSKGIAERELVLATTAAFSHFRVLPRVSTLRQQHPEINLRLTTQMFTSDLRLNEVDVAIRYGDGKWRDGTSILLFDEEVFPVCSPAWRDANPGVESLTDLTRAALIDYDSTSEGWLAWDEWFSALGVRPPKLKYALRCGLYTDAVQATMHGQGVALGWRRLLEDHLSSGRLVRLTEATLKVRDAYFAVVPNGREITREVRVLIDWLRDAALPT